MFTSDKRAKPLINSVYFNLGFAIFAALFGAIYEMFSHEVYSYYMIYAFGIPLVLGVLCQVLTPVLFKRFPHGFESALWNLSIVTYTVGSLLKGIVDIYGSSNRKLVFYPITGGILALLAAISFLTKTHRRSADFNK